MALQKLTINVKGRVQMVNFRRNTRREAESLGLVGWVRNMPDGSVLITAQGDSELLSELLEWAKTGDFPANVTSVDFEFSDELEDFADFRIVR